MAYVKVEDRTNGRDAVGLSVIGSDHFAFSYHDFTLNNLIKARHRNELTKADKNYLYVDYAMRGLGSRSCGPDPEECYELRPHDFRFVFALSSETSCDKLLELCRKDFGSKTEKLSESYEWKREKIVRNIVECDLD